MPRYALATTALALAIAAAAAAQPKDNIALGKSYRLSPRPNYGLCTDKGDRVQLTDGVYTKGYFWTQKTTVGWTRANPAIITIDLGSVMPIRGVSYNTAAGRAEVKFPDAVYVLVSDDNKTYCLVGDLVKLSAKRGLPKPDVYAVHRYWTDELAAHGRYVSLMAVSSGPYIFVDEIEVRRGDDALLGQPLTGRKVPSPKALFKELAMTGMVQRRLDNDLAAVSDAAAKAGLADALKPELDAIKPEIAKLDVVPDEDFKTILPLNDLHRRIFAAQAKVWRKSFSAPIVAWQKCKWDMLSPTEPPRRGGAKVDVAMMRREFRSAAFNLSNTANAAADLRLRIVGLPPGDNPGYVTVHDAPFTDTRSGVPVAAALPLAERDGDAYRIHIEPGMTRHIWLTFHPTDLAAGDYAGEIDVQPAGVRIPVRLKLYPIDFPIRPALHLGGWDYTNNDRMYDITRDNRDAVIQHLKDHFVDTPWATGGALARGKYDREGNMVEAPSDANFKTWLERWPDAGMYCVFMAFRDTFAGFEMGTPRFERAVSNWITWWVERAGKSGIEPQRLGLLLVDEPSSHKRDKTIIEYAKVIQKAQPKVVVWEDPTWREPWNALQEMFKLSDVLCPNLPMWIEHGQKFADFFVRQRDAGRELWFYSCSGPGKLLDPYAYHRMQEWFCWRYGAKGSCFWAFGDSNKASSWNEYLSHRGAFTPMFLDSKSVTPGKHMEAIREGVEDYEYLRMLRDAVAAGRGDAATLEAAQKLLDSAAMRVTACMTGRDKIKWSEEKDRSVADAVRLEVLEMLGKLSAK